MKRKFWLPSIATLLLLNLFFNPKISIDDSAEHVVMHDEVIDLNDLGEEEVVKTECFVDYDDFEDFLFGLGEKPLYSKSVQELDTTGDGRKETIIEEVYLEDGKCIVKNVIFKGKKEIWRNEFSLNSDQVNWYFGKDMNKSGMMDYAMFYLGVSKSGFVQKLYRNSEFEDRTRTLSRHYQKDSGLDYASMYNSDFHEYLLNYEGYYVFDRSPGNNSIYFWSEEEQSFVQLYETHYAPNLI